MTTGQAAAGQTEVGFEPSRVWMFVWDLLESMNSFPNQPFCVRTLVSSTSGRVLEIRLKFIL